MAERQGNQPSTPDIGSYNDAIAAIYDKATANQEWSINEFVAERLRDYPGMGHMALDLGAGTGQTTGVVLEEVDAARVVAVDASPGMLTQLQVSFTHN